MKPNSPQFTQRKHKGNTKEKTKFNNKFNFIFNKWDKSIENLNKLLVVIKVQRAFECTNIYY